MENAVARIVILCNSTNYVHPNIEPIKTIHSARARAHTRKVVSRGKKMKQSDFGSIQFSLCISWPRLFYFFVAVI